jgi:amidase
MTTPTATRSDALTDMSATALARAIRERTVSSLEVVDAYLSRIDEVNPSLNAMVQICADAARSRATEADAALARGDVWGPLHGVPFTAKDALDTAGVVSTGGTQGRAHFVPEHDATAVARMKSAGGILLGKTNAPELSLAFETHNLVYGRTNNPYNPARTPGGSSGGEAAIIAAGGSPLGLGTDAAGSIRWPAHCCGIAGIKPTRGRVPMTGAFPPAMGLTASLWHLGPLARYVEDFALALPIIAGVDMKDSTVAPAPLGNPEDVNLGGVRVAFYTDDGIATAGPEIGAAVRSAADLLANDGLAVAEARPAGIEQTFEMAMGLFGADGGAGVQSLLHLAGTREPSPFLLRLGHDLQPFAMGTTADLSAFLVKLDVLRTTMLQFLESYDVIVCPVNASPALPHGATWDQIFGFGYTVAHNLTGWPAVVVRVGATPEGLPIGVQVVARPWREDVALRVAQRIESAFGGWQPPAM